MSKGEKNFKVYNQRHMKWNPPPPISPFVATYLTFYKINAYIKCFEPVKVFRLIMSLNGEHLNTVKMQIQQEIECKRQLKGVEKQKKRWKD